MALRLDMRPNIVQHSAQRILVLDGAMGTMIQRHALEEADFRGERFAEHASPLKGNNDLLALTRPDILRGIHDAYFEAGADIVETNTFSSTTIAQADYGLESAVWDLNVASAEIARASAEAWTAKTPDQPRFVAGSVGPTNRTASISPDVNDPGYRAVTFRDLVAAYRQQMEALMVGGVDTLLIETVFDTLNAKAALFAAEEAFDRQGRRVPIMVSGTITDASGRTLSGQTAEAFWVSMSHAPLFSIGLNCALGAEQLTPYLEALSDSGPLRHFCPPQRRAAQRNGRIRARSRRHGRPTRGLSGQRPRQHLWVAVAAPRQSTSGPSLLWSAAKARVPFLLTPTTAIRMSRQRPLLSLSGLEPLWVTPESNFVNVGERTNVTGSRKFLRLIREDRFEEAVEVAREQVEGGAQILDVNMDEGMLDSAECMQRFLNLIAAEPDIARIPGHDRQLQMGGHRGRFAVRSGQGRGEFHQPQGRRSRISAPSGHHSPLRRCGHRHGL